MKKIRAMLLALMMVLSLAACGAKAPAEEPAPAPEADAPEAEAPAEEAGESYTIATVVKLTGVAWFDRMEVGVNRFAADHPEHDVFQTGAATADPAEQVRVIEDLIAQGVDAITVVPNSTESLEAVLGKAMEQGIVVVAHEASTIQNADCDVEAFVNAEYGDHFMGEGQYTTFVGALTATSHNEWVDASVARQEAEYPNMELISNKNETTENEENAYTKTKELLTAYPELVGFQGSAMTDVPGVGRAIQEAGKQDSTVVIGTSLVSVAGKYLEDGSIDMISFWDPAEAGYAMNELALHLLEGGKIEDGMSLTAPGYQNLKLDGKVLYGSAWIDVTVDNMGDYDF